MAHPGRAEGDRRMNEQHYIEPTVTRCAKRAEILAEIGSWLADAKFLLSEIREEAGKT